MDELNPSKRKKVVNLLKKFEENRKNVSESIMTFNFNKQRIKHLSELNDVKENCKGILYWMFRDIRTQDNWALLFAQKIAVKRNVPLHICFCIMPSFLNASMRYYKFLLKGLMEIEEECKQLNLNFHLLHGEPNESILKFVKTYNMGAVIVDFYPLKLPMLWIDNVQKNLPEDVPIYQIDAHNIVPCWYASSKQEFAAKTIRNKINTKLQEFLTEFPPVIKHPYLTKEKFENNNWDITLQDVEASKPTTEITWAKPGYRNGIKELENFIQNHLQKYGDERNNPLSNAISNLSPWFHFGMISVQRCILEIQEYKGLYKKSVESFMEEAIIRRELSDNFCFYNEKYDLVEGAYPWAIKTLNKHRKDTRKYVYSLSQLENSKTHDDLWNACQNQMIITGKMHGFLRMYWAKKLLEWTETPEIALEWANYLNNKYSIDGCDPNGYVGCMWSICGVHDHGWPERDIFGKIRYMNYNGCKRKFNVAEFVMKWGKKKANELI
ncbi:deoxyribodipyrimidine photo-lyase-like [Bombus bifarius]|uniref:Deoxyribodipyrimidine photo-lyase n=2 Tax=Pyrobombus TaxID=144703 RepID=A0A6P8MC67_9HYME|nr:deoxyribodipyrimidine photo-lyase-like [Bombus vancouverensis nearcticus]XP_033299257.1 deoxyribodipyrimidine photo-lyase-like [Bombus bifarius]XP_050477117.1 deoxyribodipyrimidine photo-lyase-like isoform X1 [Bombus huntii]XP_050477118.1 deoxyribodipyrimidine photo-lyase-like isoform X1 [Bombus huntii]